MVSMDGSAASPLGGKSGKSSGATHTQMAGQALINQGLGMSQSQLPGLTQVLGAGRMGMLAGGGLGANNALGNQTSSMAQPRAHAPADNFGILEKKRPPLGYQMATMLFRSTDPNERPSMRPQNFMGRAGGVQGGGMEGMNMTRVPQATSQVRRRNQKRNVLNRMKEAVNADLDPGKIATYAEEKSYKDFVVDFLDSIRESDFDKVVKILKTIQAVNNEQPERDFDTMMAGVSHNRTFFQESRLAMNADKQFTTYEDIIFELVNYIDPRNHFTPLLWAILHDSDKICDLLLTLKANPSVQHPLKKCVIWRRPKCCEVLLRHGANRLQKDEDGRIPFEYLASKKHNGGRFDVMERLETRILRMHEEEEETLDSILDEDAIFMQEMLKPTRSDFEYLERKRAELQLQSVSLWSSNLEEIAFVQDLRVPPSYFVISHEDSVVLKTPEGRSLRALPGTIWQQIGIESVPNEPLCYWVHLSNGLLKSGIAGDATSGWVFWDRREWNREASRLGLIPGKQSRTVDKELGMAMVSNQLAIAQDSDAWGKMPAITPVQIFNSTLRKTVSPKSSLPLKARSGPTLSKNSIVVGLPYKIGEQVACVGQIVLDGGWTFYNVRRRHYAQPNECDGSGWLCVRDRNYITTVLKH